MKAIQKINFLMLFGLIAGSVHANDLDLYIPDTHHLGSEERYKDLPADVTDNEPEFALLIDTDQADDDADKIRLGRKIHLDHAIDETLSPDTLQTPNSPWINRFYKVKNMLKRRGFTGGQAAYLSYFMLPEKAQAHLANKLHDLLDRYQMEMVTWLEDQDQHRDDEEHASVPLF